MRYSRLSAIDGFAFAMFNDASPRFADRVEAGQRLATELKTRSFPDPVVLALPRGGVPVGFEVARVLDAPLDVLLVRKIGAPGYEELGIGAVADGEHPEVVLNTETIAMLNVSRAYIEQERDRQLAEIERRRRLYRGDAPAVSVKDRTAIIVDDGIATGGTMLVALRAIRKASPKQIVLAVPVAPSEAIAKVSGEADQVICLATPSPFGAIGAFYTDFSQTADEEVIKLLTARRSKNEANRG